MPRPPQGLDRKGQFVATVDKAGDTNPNALSRPVSPHMLIAGSVISASLITGLDSDLPGIVTAQVTQNAYDSATGRTLLVPQGARLIGNYDHVVAFGQQRALVVWQRLVMPDGSSIRLENEPASDPSGYAGLADKVDFHTWRLLKGVAIATLLGVGTELSFSGESDLVEAIRESGQTNVARAGDQITQRNLSIPPTIRIRPGVSVRLVVHRDLVLAPGEAEDVEMGELRLGKLPDRTPVKLTISVTPDLHAGLIAYAALYAETYGSKEAVSDLVPAMLASFLESDRSFTRTRRGQPG